MSFSNELMARQRPESQHIYSEIRDVDRTIANEELYAQLNRIETLPYFRDVNRTEAEDILERHAKEPGVFLLRWSSEPLRVAITSVVSKGRIAHVQIIVKQGTYHLEKDIPFHSIQDLVAYYACRPIPAFTQFNSDARLTKPIKRCIRPSSQPRIPGVSRPLQRPTICYSSQDQYRSFGDTDDTQPKHIVQSSCHCERHSYTSMRLQRR
uniref:uncharacterized protein LOC100183040 n=1 Tax=Ciona intestinalis TaxID=7719 RepID=UPI00006A4086|nr:uncharacterized protein LOC100183040 [Ciona intestinalis]|eukprot:XP_002122524.3 uncharacterized protein LOC100183040 [Ciona intestinalis]